MKTPDENPIERWIRESDTDGRNYLFEFTDADIPILRDAIRQEIKKALAIQMDEVLKEMEDWGIKAIIKIKTDYDSRKIAQFQMEEYIKNIQELKTRLTSQSPQTKPFMDTRVVATSCVEQSVKTTELKDKTGDTSSSICKWCKKPKSEHIPCLQNENVFWCYPSINNKGYDPKKHRDKWAYMFEPKSSEDKA